MLAERVCLLLGDDRQERGKRDFAPRSRRVNEGVIRARTPCVPAQYHASAAAAASRATEALALSAAASACHCELTVNTVPGAQNLSGGPPAVERSARTAGGVSLAAAGTGAARSPKQGSR
eukprot:scaffold110511_cov72-Phaeocystis_antarctica.AAC.2